MDCQITKKKQKKFVSRFLSLSLSSSLQFNASTLAPMLSEIKGLWIYFEFIVAKSEHKFLFVCSENEGGEMTLIFEMSWWSLITQITSSCLSD